MNILNTNSADRFSAAGPNRPETEPPPLLPPPTPDHHHHSPERGEPARGSGRKDFEFRTDAAFKGTS
ncbi:hypothetical protein EYF80_054081 [Liparis tanakae]|uniref:Uncharacterized protein n=1 Tax=Liparis tanakae TaxID=230148 RepID=A0A4Z2F4E0_9TELE|nr:hypothetical protein EYF80_054081 [Liparis tanakae]